MKILVTGGLGAIGRHLVKELEARKHRVYVCDLGHSHEANYARCDVAEWYEVERLCAPMGFDLVYHAAAEFGRWNGEDYYQRMWNTNAVGTKNIIRAMERFHFQTVFFSSSEVYGDYDGLMFEELMDAQEVRQLNDYALSKWVGEQQIMNSAAMNHSESVRVRLFNTYGPGEHYSPYRSAICKFAYSALTKQKYTVYLGHNRTSTYISDLVRTLANISENFKAGEVYNIGGKDYHSMKDVSDLVLAATGADESLVGYVDGEPFTTKNKLVDVSKAERDLDHQCSVSLEDGIAATVKWMKQVYGQPVKEPA